MAGDAGCAPLILYCGRHFTKGKGFNGGKSDWEGTFAGPHGNNEDA